jgi:hypothetical protein
MQKFNQSGTTIRPHPMLISLKYYLHNIISFMWIFLCIGEVNGFMSQPHLFVAPRRVNDASSLLPRFGTERSQILLRKSSVTTQMRFAAKSTDERPVSLQIKDRIRAPMFLDDEGVWLPDDAFALNSNVIRVPGFLSKDDIDTIHATAHAVKKAVGSFERNLKLPVDLNVK